MNPAAKATVDRTKAKLILAGLSCLIPIVIGFLGSKVSGKLWSEFVWDIPKVVLVAFLIFYSVFEMTLMRYLVCLISALFGMLICLAFFLPPQQTANPYSFGLIMALFSMTWPIGVWLLFFDLDLKKYRKVIQDRRLKSH